MKKILITGGSGFIGKALVVKLKKLEYEVTTIGRSPKEDIILDLNSTSLSETLKSLEPDIIFHLASGSNVKQASENSDKEYRDVVLGTENLINAAKNLEKPIERFIFVSSQAVYGFPDSESVSEDHEVNPVNNYGKYKVNAENIILSSELPYFILRVSSVFGSNQNPERSGVVSKFIQKMKTGEEVVIYNSLESFIDLLYIDDVVDAFVQFVEDARSSSGVYNIGSGKKTTLQDILNELKVFFSDFKGFKLQINDDYKSNDRLGLCLDNSKVKSKFNWSPQFTLHSSLKAILKDEQKIKK